MLRRNSDVGFFDDEDTKDVIRKIAAAQKLTIFTGAGIAADLKIPNWSGLVARLLHNLELPRHDHDAAQAHLAVQTALDSFHQLPTASIVDATYRRRHDDSASALAERNEDIAKILYTPNGQLTSNQVPEDALAIYVLRLAIAKRLAGCDVHIMTTNYDDSLEYIAKSRQDLGLGDLGADGVPVFSNWDTDGDPAHGVPVSHVHGLIPRSGSAQGVVFSEREYIDWDRQSPWRDYLAKRLASDGVTLFVGASLRDYNIAAMLKRFSHGNVYALLPVEDEIRQAAERKVEWSPTTTEYATLRGLHLGVQVLRPDFYGQVCQFLNEVATSAGLEAPDYSDRLRDWSHAWSTGQPYGVEILVQRCEQLRAFAMQENRRLGQAEHVKVEVWVRDDPDSRELTLYSTSQTVVLPGHGYWPHKTPIKHQSRYSAVSAFAARCATEGRVVYRNDGRWTHFLAVPIILTDAPYYELPVGVATVLMHAPNVHDDVYFGDAQSADMRELSVRMKELGQEFLWPVNSS
jgi:SIR2-like protein